MHTCDFVLDPVGVCQTCVWIPQLEQHGPHAPPAHFGRIRMSSFEGIWTDALLEGDFIKAGTFLRFVGNSIVDGYWLDGDAL